jgi:thiol-disulfide isomerase/thioredoxin
MRKIALGFLLCISSISARAANPQTLKEQYQALVKEFDATVEAWEKRADETKQDTEPWPAHAFIPRFLKLAEANPAEPGATDALLWVVNKAMNIPIGGRDFYPHYRHALELLTRGGQLDDARLGRACTQGLRYPSVPTESFLRLLTDRSRNREVRGRALLALARIFVAKASLARLRQLDPNARSPAENEFIKGLDPDYVKYFHDVDFTASKVEAERLFEQCIKDYGDVLYRRARSAADRDVTIAEAARSDLHELRDLAIGKVAPEIVGEDIDGNPMKLSDYQGKIVVLIFWATWCSPCMSLIPHERSLVERLKDKPFVLIGIDGDDDRERAKRAVKQERITWRSWWNGGPTGPITAQYNVEGWPTVFVLDEHGVIRFKQVVEKNLDEAVDALLKGISKAKP